MLIEKYYLPNISVENLEQLKFKCKHHDDGDVYCYTFPIIPNVLIGKISLYPPNKTIRCDVYDICNNTLYAPYYYSYYGKYDVLITKIDNGFINEFKKMGIKKRKKKKWQKK